MNKGFAPIIVFIIAALVAVGVGGYLVFGPEKESALSEDKSVQPVVDETADWETYRNEELGYELMYPPFWGVNDELKRLINFGPEPNLFGRYARFSCPSQPPENANAAGTGNNITLTIGGEEVIIPGIEFSPLSPGIEGEAFGFLVSRCSKTVDNKYTWACLSFGGYNQPINKIDRQFIESVSFFRSLDSRSIRGDCSGK